MTATPHSTPTLHRGLAGVLVDETRVSHVDGARGHLIIHGEPIEDLAGRVSFDALCARLLELAPERAPEALAEARRAIAPALDRAALAATDVMDALRAAIARLDGARFDHQPLAVVAAVGVALAGWLRVRAGLDPVAPCASSTHAEDLLRMATGHSPDPAAAAALDAYLVTVIDHGFNASTFAARVVASTGSDLISAVTAAIGALKGPLHGGAPGPVLDMLDAIAASGSPPRAWLESELAAGRRIMGMGHRVYRTRDPRAAALEAALATLEAHGGDPRIAQRLALARQVEHEAQALLAEHRPGRELRANVEFYTAVLLEAVGLPREAFSGVFAASRVAGWCAHVAEQRAHGTLIRPSARYVGLSPAGASA